LGLGGVCLIRKLKYTINKGILPAELGLTQGDIIHSLSFNHINILQTKIQSMEEEQKEVKQGADNSVMDASIYLRNVVMKFRDHLNQRANSKGVFRSNNKISIYGYFTSDKSMVV
jgi:hypothetical protein